MYRDPFPEDDVREIRRMKARVERERIPPGEDPQFHLKLGQGRAHRHRVHGAAAAARSTARRTPRSARRRRSTALDRLVDAGLLDDDDARRARGGVRFCERARNARYLVTGTATDALPSGRRGRRIARLLGLRAPARGELRDDYRRVTRRARKVVERLFYGA